CRIGRRRPSGQPGTPEAIQCDARPIPQSPSGCNRRDEPMTLRVNHSATSADRIALDAPIFDPAAFRLDGEQAAIITGARELGQTLFAGRAAAYDRGAMFPTENYRDMHRAGLLGIAIPKQHGGLGAGYQTYALAAAEIGRYCGATALTWNMHVCSTLWT